MVGLAAVGFGAGAALGIALLSTDTLGLGALVAADTSPLLVATLFVGSLGLLFMPASLATGLADPRRSPEKTEIAAVKGRHR